MLNPISNFYFKMLVILSKKLYLHTRANNNTTFGAKLLPRRRFLQHYYRNMFIESHKKPTDVL